MESPFARLPRTGADPSKLIVECLKNNGDSLMTHKHLKNKPLVEAHVEIEWALQEQAQGIKTDPYYKMALGRFYERIMNEYPEHETLAAAKFPETMVYHTAQHLFRVARGRWPAIQMGPG